MRLDKFLSETGAATRREAAKAARKGRIEVNGATERDVARQIDPASDKVKFDGEEIQYRRFTYIMLNKPDGYVSATEDGKDKTVLELLPERLRRPDLFPCGRLDKDTTGLMLLTDNGGLAHRLLSPKRHVEKKYRFECASEVSEDERLQLETGLVLADGYLTKPAKVELDVGRKSGIITLHEGKYHQIKRMFGAANGNRITCLERIEFGPLSLDPELPRGGWRYLTPEEEKQIEKY
jgi:16S rRNA pseudouridine516 synthase